MASFDDELLSAAKLLVKRKKGQKGKLPQARIRRSISTIYYALFHFILAEVGRSVVGATNDVRVRRSALGRTVTHQAIKIALGRVRGRQVEKGFEEFFRYRLGNGPVNVPDYARQIALTFIDAQSKRHDADYNLEESLGARDVELLQRRVSKVIANWRGANQPSDRDFKKSLCLLVTIGGKLRRD
jgi:hypothetical protein